VFSPYNNQLIELTGIAPGTLVADPQYPEAEKNTSAHRESGEYFLWWTSTRVHDYFCSS
jgi:hypothetical protein